jgi:hypothetical protein
LITSLEFVARCEEALEALHAPHLHVRPGLTGTLISDSELEVFTTPQRALAAAAHHLDVAMAVKVSSACLE